MTQQYVTKKSETFKEFLARQLGEQIEKTVLEKTNQSSCKEVLYPGQKSKLAFSSEKQPDLGHSAVQLKTKYKSSTVHGPFEEFSNDLLSILNDASSSDVTIKCGNEVLKAHKLILSARSPVFKAMFSTSMRESTEGTVSIDDIDPQTVRDMLDFIYSNQIQNVSVPKACDLLHAAEKYQLQTLKNVCVDFLVSNLSEENAFLILQKADLYDVNLKSYTIKFISDKFSVLKVAEEWKTLQSQNPTLALEVLNKVVERL